MAMTLRCVVLLALLNAAYAGDTVTTSAISITSRFAPLICACGVQCVMAFTVSCRDYIMASSLLHKDHEDVLTLAFTPVFVPVRSLIGLLLSFFLQQCLRMAVRYNDA